MAHKPAKALILHGDGFMRAIQARHSHLHELAAVGSCGFLALREVADSGGKVGRVVGDFAQLLDTYEAKTLLNDDAVATDGASEESNVCHSMPSIADRFMGINAALFTNFPPVADFAQKAGLSILSLQDNQDNDEQSKLPSPSWTASQLLNMLELADSDSISNKTHQDLIWVHLVASEEEDTVDEQLCYEVDWMDNLLGALQERRLPGTKAATHLYIILVLGYGSLGCAGYESIERHRFPVLECCHDLKPELALVRPKQSYLMKGGQYVSDVRQQHPMLVSYHLDGVTRRDEAKKIQFEEFLEHSGNLTILAERFVHEVAFKLWKAPKYGA